MNVKNWVGRLIWATIIVTVVRYSAAFMASDLGMITGWLSDVVTFFLTLTGLGMGILDVLGGGLLFNGLRKVMPRTGDKPSIKFKILSFCVILLVGSGMIILVPFTMSRLAHESVLDALGGKFSVWAWVWSSMVNLIPYILIFGVFTGNRLVEELETSESSRKVPPTEPESSGKVPQDWRKVRHMLTNTDLNSLARLTPDGMRQYSVETGYTYKTISNWRSRAREELGMSQETA